MVDDRFPGGSAGSACPDLRLAGSAVRHDQLPWGLRSGSRAQPRSREAEMTEPGAVLEAAHTAIADLAAVLVAVRSGLGGESVPAGRHLEMGEIDLLSARDAVEKARFPWGRSWLRSAAPERISVTAGAEVRSRLPGRRRAGTRRHGFPGHGQGRVVLGTRRLVACLAVGVSRSGQNLVGPVLRSNEY